MLLWLLDVAAIRFFMFSAADTTTYKVVLYFTGGQSHFSLNMKYVCEKKWVKNSADLPFNS